MSDQTNVTVPTPRDPAPEVGDRIVGGIEWFTLGDDWEDCQCARCGSSCAYAACSSCGGEGEVEDTRDWTFGGLIEEYEPCPACRGARGSYHCVSGPDWCEANPLPGRDHICSTALTPEAWSDA